jgi:cyclopentanol dehydrogenase
MKLKDKVVILTGAASGIGRAAAVLLGKEGAKLVLSDVNEAEGKETLTMVEKEKGNAIFLICDVTKKTDVKKMVDKTVEKYGKIDILINNAGVVKVGQVEDMSEEEYDLLLNVNLKGPYFCCHYVVPYLKKQRSGIIINIASVAGHIGQVNHALYCSTKHGIRGMTKALALDLAPYNIRVNSVSPGATDTPMLVGDVTKQAKDRGVKYEVVRKEFEEEGVMGRWASSEEIATGILFLASDESSYMTGADLLLDGGWTAR